MAKKIMKKILNKGADAFEELNSFIEYEIAEKFNQNEFSDLAQAIIKGYEASNETKFQTKKTFAPSSIVYSGGNGICPRYWYLAFSGGEFVYNNDGKSIANMDSGTDRHKRIEAAMQGAGVLTQSELDIICDDPPIYGKVDCVIDWKDTEYVGEIKTKDDEGFNYYKRSMKPSSYHVLQLLIYMKILKKKKGLLIYENKNSHDILILPVNVNQEHVDFVNYLFDWMKTVYGAWKDQTLPKIPFRSEKQIKLCDRCPLQKQCSEAPAGEVFIERRKDEKGLF